MALVRSAVPKSTTAGLVTVSPGCMVHVDVTEWSRPWGHNYNRWSLRAQLASKCGRLEVL